MKVIAKFKCTAVEKVESYRTVYDESDPNHRTPLRDADGYPVMKEKFLYTAKFSIVGVNSEENARFWDASPMGSLQLTSILVDAFEPGVEYFVELTAAKRDA